MKRTNHIAKQAVVAVVLCGLCACLGHKADAEPIAECKQFEKVLGACEGKKVSLPIAAAPIGKSPEERERMKQLCILSTQRLQRACR